ncbi:MAG: hypothetical protein KGN34_13305 [Sphingomonadales bacterium]|nr:hypothetical protein [Sphingomonadales bacterium]
MPELRPMASLTSGLLARKGAARPAMRSTLHAPDMSVPSMDDLGWNDFGHHAPAQAPAIAASAVVVPIAAHAEAPVAPAPVQAPVVVRQQQAIAEAVAVANPAPAPRSPLVRKSALAQGRRAAFTLRLDAERHLALRVAATMLGRSAQQIVTDALDELIARHPEIHTIAGQIHGRR